MAERAAIGFRIRTALYIAATFSFLLSVYFIVSFFSVKDALRTRSDEEVYSQLESVLSGLTARSDNYDFQRLAKEHSTTGEAQIGLGLIRSDKPSFNYQTFGPEHPRQLLDSHTFNPAQLPLDITVGKESYRVFSRSQGVFTVFASISTLTFQEVSEAMISRYLILLATGAFVSFLLGLFTADRALKPLKLLIASAQRIKEKDDAMQSLLPTQTRTLEINELAIVINEILQERDRNIVALKNFTADAAHELRTPLTILKGELEVDLRTKSFSAEDRVAHESNLEEVERLIHIVEDLLFLARSEQLTHPVSEQELVTWSLDQLVSDSCDRLRPLIESKQITLTNKCNTNTHLIFPRLDIERIIFNILLNATQYTPDHGSITIVSKQTIDRTIEVSISDTGIGIAAEELPHIFDRFWRADRSRSRQAGGTGLGLTIANTVAQQYGIKLICESKGGIGTTMRCIFPI